MMKQINIKKPKEILLTPRTESTARYLQEIQKYKNSEQKEERDKFEQIHLGNESAREEMICSHLKFVVSIAKKYLFSSLELDDLIQEGNMGLCRAIEKFDATR